MLIIAAVAALAAAGRFSISEGVPAAWAPLPLAVMIPVFWAMSATGEALSLRWLPQAIPSLVGPVLFIAWYPQLLTGASQVPRRTLIGLVVLSALTAIHFVLGWDFGLKYDGRSYVVAVTCANVAAIAACWGFVIYARRRPSFEATLLAHAFVALWLAWIAFPWLGELP
jgi:hypothetical protein